MTCAHCCCRLLKRSMSSGLSMILSLLRMETQSDMLLQQGANPACQETPTCTDLS